MKEFSSLFLNFSRVWNYLVIFFPNTFLCHALEIMLSYFHLKIICDAQFPSQKILRNSFDNRIGF